MFLWFSFLQGLGLFAFWPLCIFFLFKERVQTLLTILFSMGLVCSVVNAFLFVVDYGPMDIALTFERDLQSPGIGYVTLNVVAMILCCALVSLLLKKNNDRKWLSSIAVVGILSFIVLGILNVRIIAGEYGKYQDLRLKNMASVDGLEPVFNFTKTGRNVVVIMLDRASSAYLEHIFKDQPDLYDMFDGFTYFKNTLGFGPKTLTGAPALYGGYEYSPAEINFRTKDLLKDKHHEALLLMPRILTEQADFSAVMADSSWGNYSFVADMSFTEKYKKIQGVSLWGNYVTFVMKDMGLPLFADSLEKALRRNLLWASAFRSSPTVVRPVIYYKGTYFNPEEIVGDARFFGWFSSLYALPFVSSFDSPDDSVIILTNEITHESSGNGSNHLVAHNEFSFPNSLHYKENTFAFQLLGQWFDVLRDNGVYDNTRIIIISDHGVGNIGSEVLGHLDYDSATIDGFSKDYLNSLLLYKDFGSSGRLETDMTFMTTADVPTMTFESIVENPVNPFTGKPINSESKKAGVFVTTDDSLWAPYHSKSEYVFTVPDDSWYRVKDNIFIDSNWTQEVPK